MAPFWIKLSSLAVVLLFCWIATCTSLLGRHEQLKGFSTDVEALLLRKEALEKQKMLHHQMMQQIREASPEYVKQNIETLPLLQGERQRVAALLKQFPENASLKDRSIFLESSQNQISFDEVREGGHLELHLSRRVQMDLSDLRKFLEAVEADRYDAAVRKPFLVMKKFDLMKCYEKGDEKIYSIYAELLQK